jgi:ABC-type uncharacterized transport system permease subunit
MLSLALAVASIVVYGLATAELVRALWQGESKRNRLGVALGALAMVAHLYLVMGAILMPTGLALGFFNALSLAAAVMALLIVLLTLAQPVENLGIALFPLAAVALLGQVGVGQPDAGATLTDTSPGLNLHVLVSMSSHAVLGLAALQGLVLGLQHRLLHDRRPMRALRGLPPLSVMEKLLFHMIAIGFVLLTVALASGLIYLEDMFAQHLVHKTVLTMAAWVVFGILLGGHYIAGWRGPTAVKLTVGAFVLLVLGYFGSKLVLELILDRAQ